MRGASAGRVDAAEDGGVGACPDVWVDVVNGFDSGAV